MALFKKDTTEEQGDLIVGNEKEIDTTLTKKEKRKKAKGEKKKKNIPLRIGVILVILALLLSSVFIVLNSRFFSNETTAYVIKQEMQTPDYLKEKTLNILVVGVDSDSTLEGNDERKVKMTDVIMLINFDREANKATVLQIPRDTYVGDIVPYGKINGLYQWGITDKKPEEGEPAIGIGPLLETIHDQLQITIDGYVMITMEGFRNAVDMIGGVNVVLPPDAEPIDIEGHFVLKPGDNEMNGEAAEVFVRYRNYEHADIDRMGMQQLFMKGLMEKLFTMSTSEMISITKNIRDQVESNLTIQEMIQLLNEAKELNMESIRVFRVPGEPVQRYGAYGVDVYSVHLKQLTDLLNMYMRPYRDDVHEADLKAIEIQNTRNDWVDPALLTPDEKAALEPKPEEQTPEEGANG